jgi:CDP-diglyceride synthetase
MPGYFIGQQKGGMRVQFSSIEKSWEGLLVAAIVMSLILILAMLVGNYL